MYSTKDRSKKLLKIILIAFAIEWKELYSTIISKKCFRKAKVLLKLRKEKFNSVKVLLVAIAVFN